MASGAGRTSPPPGPAVGSDVEAGLQGTFEIRARRFLRPRGDSLSQPTALSSSLPAPTPARSYYHSSFRPPSGYADSISNSFARVREDTAQLASRAVADAQHRSNSPRNPVPDRASVSHVRASIQGYFHTPAWTEVAADDAYRETSSIGSQTQPRGEGQVEGYIPTSPSTRPITQANTSRRIQSTDRNGVPAVDGLGPYASVTVKHAIISQPHERTPLLRADSLLKSHSPPSLSSHDAESLSDRAAGAKRRLQQAFGKTSGQVARHVNLLLHPKAWDKAAVQSALLNPVRCLPAVLLGLLLNILDALSYGLILFPLGNSIFAGLGPDGISMFYVSCIVSQLVYSLGGSAFKGGVGSEMIEVVPFFHKMAFTILARVGDSKPETVLATTILSYSTSSVVTGLVFYILGKCHLGMLIGFFPRHILIGCIGGVGWFLVATGVEVSARLDGNLNYDLPTLKKLFEADTVALWTVPLLLAIILLISKRWVKHAFTDAAYFLGIIVVFYIVEAAIPSVNVETLRAKGWIFDAPASDVPWWHFYTLYDFAAVDWTAFASTIPAMLALTFFGVLHVPINVPALGLSAGEDHVDVDRELRAHGYSNALSGLCGSIQNYLVYTNSVLFMRSGGNSRLAGVLLALATVGVLMGGLVIIGFIPVMVVGALIFFLGFDLLREAVIDPLGRVHRLEYLTILIIVVTMGAYDFVVGIIVGIVLACVGYVIRTSRISAIRAAQRGGIANSLVRRHPVQHTFLREVGSQIYVMRLAGYLFFGTIVGVENRIREMLSEESFATQPIRFLVMDLSNVDGVDFSAAEAFTRINRLLEARDIEIILCGFDLQSDVGYGLLNVGLLDEVDGVEYFETLNSALEFCENELLRAFYQQEDAMDRHRFEPKALDIPRLEPPTPADDFFYNSPRRGQLQAAATTTLEEHGSKSLHQKWRDLEQPLQLIVQTFVGFSERDEAFWARAAPFFHRREVAAGMVLYRMDDPADGFYLIESGILKARYDFPQGSFSEVIVAGATCGELPFFSQTPRTSTTKVERAAVVWMLDQASWARLQASEPDLALEVYLMAMKLTSERMGAITRYMLLTGT